MAVFFGQNPNQEVILVHQDIKLPEIIDQPDINYPIELGDRGRVKVIIKATIDTAGFVNNPEVVWTQDALFNQFAVKLASLYRFKPGKIDGVVREITISWPIVFLNKTKN